MSRARQVGQLPVNSARSHVLASRPIRKWSGASDDQLGHRPLHQHAVGTGTSQRDLVTVMRSGWVKWHKVLSSTALGRFQTRPESALDRLPLNQAGAGQRRCGRPTYLAPDSQLPDATHPHIGIEARIAVGRLAPRRKSAGSAGLVLRLRSPGPSSGVPSGGRRRSPV